MKYLLAAVLMMLIGTAAGAEIGVISPDEAQQLIKRSDASKKPIVLDSRGGYKDYFRGHLPTAHHLNFDTLRGTDSGVPVQYPPDELTKALLLRAGVDRNRTHRIYVTGDKLSVLSEARRQLSQRAIVKRLLERVRIGRAVPG